MESSGVASAAAVDYLHAFIISLIILGTISFIFITGVILHSLWSIFKTMFCYYFDTTRNLNERFGEWAVITGSTDGIGKAYAIELAKKGMNIVLISRTQDRLVHTANFIECEYNVKTKIIVADFSKGYDNLDHIEQNIQDLNIGVLVNNVGKQYLYPMYLDEINQNELREIVNVNIGAVTMMTRMVLPIMLKQKKGAIVNISSGAELQPLPLMTVYAATKVFIRYFTLALRSEYSSCGIVIQHLSPMFLNTKMNSFSKRLQKSNMFVPDAHTYAKHAVSTLGKVHSTTGYWIHGIQYTFIRLSPEWMRITIGGFMNKVFRQDYQKNFGKS